VDYLYLGSLLRKGSKNWAKSLLRATGSGHRVPEGQTLVSSDPDLIPDLESIVESSTKVDPESYGLWIFLSTRKIAEILASKGHSISHHKVGVILNELGYSLQSNRKFLEGRQHEDRNEQFLFRKFSG
jgi:hypothetical protein